MKGRSRKGMLTKGVSMGWRHKLLHSIDAIGILILAYAWFRISKLNDQLPMHSPTC